MHVDPFFEEDPVKKIVFEERGKEPTVKDLSRQVGKINYENIFPESEDFLQVNPFLDNKEEDPFREMFTSPGSEDFIRNVPSFSLQDAFQNEGKYFGCAISERRACHSGNSSPGDIFLVNKEIERIKQELKKVD